MIMHSQLSQLISGLNRVNYMDETILFDMNRSLRNHSRIFSPLTAERRRCLSESIVDIRTESKVE